MCIKLVKAFHIQKDNRTKEKHEIKIECNEIMNETEEDDKEKWEKKSKKKYLCVKRVMYVDKK